VNAATPGTDNANDPAYTAAWSNGTDGGTAATFGPWSLTNASATSGFFIGDSTTLNSPGGNINTNNKSFGMFAHSGQSADATRAFGSALTAGQTFSLDMAVNFRNGNKGFDLLAGGTSIFNLNVGGDAYTVNNAATGNGSIFGNLYDSNTVFHLTLTQTTLAGGSWTVTRSGGLTGTVSGTYSGDATGFHFYNSQTTGNGASEDNLFFNNLAVTNAAVPEPATVLLVGPALLGGMFFVRRRRS
jgi:hypothetical protein